MLLPHINLHYSTLCTAFLLHRSGLFFRTGYNPSGYHKESKVENAWIKLSPMFPARIREWNQRYMRFNIPRLHLTSQSLYQHAFQIKQRERHGHGYHFVSFPARCEPFYIAFSHSNCQQTDPDPSPWNPTTKWIVKLLSFPTLYLSKARFICAKEEHRSPECHSVDHWSFNITW